LRQEGQAIEGREEDAIEPLGAPTDLVRPTGRVRGGGGPARIPWPGRRTRGAVAAFLVGLAVLVLLAILVGTFGLRLFD
jgi:hypothetical protein